MMKFENINIDLRIQGTQYLPTDAQTLQNLNCQTAIYTSSFFKNYIGLLYITRDLHFVNFHDNEFLTN